MNQLAYYKKQHKTKSNFQVWQEGYHPELVQSNEMLTQKMEYIHNNLIVCLVTTLRIQFGNVVAHEALCPLSRKLEFALQGRSQSGDWERDSVLIKGVHDAR